MTHFNHEWDTTKTPAVPVSVGDRFYAQDLNDDFNYLKHLPYEAILQGRPRGVLIPPTDTWDINNHTLTLSGGFGVVALNTQILDNNEDFTIPPKTITSYRYERVIFPNTVLVLPNDNAIHYIVATPTKRGFLQRAKALFAEQYDSRIQYDGIISIQNTAPTTEQILVGLCHDNEYLLCKDYVLNQGVGTIKLQRWYGEQKIVNAMVSVLQAYYNTSVTTIESRIYIKNNHDGIAIYGGSYKNCTIYIETVSSNGGGFAECTLDNCDINISVVTDNGIGIYDNSRITNSRITISTIYDTAIGVYSAVIADTNINTTTIRGKDFVNSQCLRCHIYVDTVVNSGALAESTYFDSTTLDVLTSISDPRSVATGDAIGFKTCTMVNCIFKIANVFRARAYIDCSLYNSFLEIMTLDLYGAGFVRGSYYECQILIHNMVSTPYDSSHGIQGACHFQNCTIEFFTVYGYCIYAYDYGSFTNCSIIIHEVKLGAGIDKGIYSNCTITISSVESGAFSITNSQLQFYFVMCTLPSMPTFSYATGKGLVINNVTVIGL